jgi:hypothetical protein
MRQMSEVTYYAALPFVPSDDGIPSGEAIESLRANDHETSESEEFSLGA